MLKKLIAVATVSTFMMGTAYAYSQTSLFGTGYGFAGYNNFSNGAAQADALNKPQKTFISTKESYSESDGEAVETTQSSEINVSDINKKYDESPNAGYKTNYRYIEKDMSDYNPYTGSDSGVNNSKSIYKDNLGRLHFFGKNNQVKESN